MAHFSSRKPPDGLSQISEGVFVFGCCFTRAEDGTDEYRLYVRHIASRLRKKFPGYSFMVHNFGDENHHKEITDSLSDRGMTVINYRCQYRKYPLLTTIHRFLSSSGSWLSAGERNVVLIVHCQNSDLTALAFLLATILIYKRQFCDERKALDMMYNKQAPREILQSLNPLPSQLVYLEYILRRNYMALEWSPMGKTLTLGRVVLDRGESCRRPIFRIYGPDLKVSKALLMRYLKQVVNDKEVFPIEAGDQILDKFSNLDSEPDNVIRQITKASGITSSTDEQLENDGEKRMNSCSIPPTSSKSHTGLNNSTTTMKSESSKVQVSIQRPAHSKVILAARTSRTSPDSISLQVPSVPISRYRSVTSSVLGITALLHDHAESSNVEESSHSPFFTPESSKSASAPIVLSPQPRPPPPPINKPFSLLPVPSPPLPGRSPPLASADHAESCNVEGLSCCPVLIPETSPSGAAPIVLPPQPPPPPPRTTKLISLSPVPSPPPPLRGPSLASAVPPPPLPPFSNVSMVRNQFAPSSVSSSTICQDSSFSLPSQKSNAPATPSPPPPPPPKRTVSTSACSPSLPARIRQVVPPPPLCAKGKFQPRTSTRTQAQPKNTVPLKPYHWLKLTRAMQGSLWAEAQKPEEASKVFELDMTELESLFSTTKSNSGHGGKTNRRGSGGLKPDKVNLIELRRAYNCEIMLSKVKVPLSDLMSSVLALDDAALDIDQVDNLIKFCPTKEEIELLTNYKGDKDNLGKCEQFFLELIKVPRVESKLRVFSFKIQFFSQVSELRRNLKIVNSASEEVKNSVKLKRIMHTILSLGNALNHGTARGSAVGFRLDSLLKLGETRSRNNKLTLIHYLCKVLAEKLPEVMDFHQDLVSLEAATKIQLKYLAEEMQAIGKGLEKIFQELNASENDGAVSRHFFKTLKEFYGSAEEEVRSLASVYSVAGRNADELSLYFGEDPSRCPFEQVVSTLLNFVRMFRRAHDENCKQLEFEKKKTQKETESVKAKTNAFRKDLEMRC